MCIPVHANSMLAPVKEINEAVLAAIWNEQAPLSGPMWDCEGNPVAVVYRGRWTAGSGPDFDGAMLSLGEGSGGRLVRGSVEMHLRCADWWAHGHHADPRYNSVALHVVLWPAGARPVERADGNLVPTLVLADYIGVATGELLDRITPLVPRLGTLSEEPCWQRTQDWPLEKLLGHIDDAGDARLLGKAARMEAGLSIHGAPDEVFYGGLMDALGYSANREPMRELAANLPVSRLLTLPLSRNEAERATLFEAVLLGAAGFLPSQRPSIGPLDWLSGDYAEEVERMWNLHAPMLDLSPERPVAGGWATERVRPANSPPRRLAAAARLLARLLWSRDGLLGPFLTCAVGGQPRAIAKEWTAMLTVPGEGYWAAHSDFGRPLESKDTALIGDSRASDIVVNIVLPLLLACAEMRGQESLREQVFAVYAAFPRLAENNVTRAMADEALGPRTCKPINGARRQQGLMHLYRLYCEARRCYECPISGLRVERQ